MMIRRFHLVVNPPGLAWAVIGAIMIWFGSDVFGGDPRVAALASRTRSSPVAGSSGGDVAGSASALNAANAAAAQRAQDSITQTVATLNALRAAQSAARAAAMGGPNNLGADPNHPGHLLPDVPDGLVSGGLVPDSGLAAPGTANPVTTWVNANTPVQSVNGIATTVAIQQTGQQAILNWQSFNIGKNTTLSLQQGGTDWVALNRILDPSLVPNQILGAINAPGGVYVLNQNGIIFGGSSQVNVRTLVASSLPINDNLVSRGLIDNPDAQFLFSSLKIPILSKNGTMPAYDPMSDPMTKPPLGYSGDVLVQPGADLESASTAEHVGGLIALIGPNVQNAGSISTPDGQTILAAGQQVGLLAHSSADPSLRGLDAFVGAVSDPASPNVGGNAVNRGVIESPRGNVTMTGKDVEQLGAIDSSTSVSLNGRVDLLANYNSTVFLDPTGANVLRPTASGVVTLGEGSVTQILPELDSAEEVTGSQLALRSQINLQGEAIYLAPNSTILAPSATASLLAGGWYQIGTLPPDFFATLGQVYLDQGATIDVSGSSDVSASVSKFFVPVELRGTELADSPLQRNGNLRGQTVIVDMRQNGTFNGQDWVGSPIGNLFGYQNLIESSVGELTTGGGSVNISAGESVVMQPGSSVNVSGGWVSYQGATVKTTQVVSGGVTYDISQATPDRVYTGIAQPLGNLPGLDGSHFDPGYVQGGNAGSLVITAPAMALDGSLLGAVTMGPNQRSSLPTAGTLTLSFKAQDPASIQPFHDFSPTPPSLSFEPIGSLVAADAFALDGSGDPVPLRQDRKQTFHLPTDVINLDGFGQVTVDNSDGDILLPAGTALNGRPGGSISLIGANVEIDGSITLPGGSVSLQANDQLLSFIRVDQAPPTADPLRGHVTIGAGASINTSGLIVDDRLTSSSAFTMPLQTEGGSVTAKGLFIDLMPGSVLDVSGGVAIGTDGKPAYGAGGGISILAGQDPNVLDLIENGSLQLGSILNGYSGNVGGSLRLMAPLVQVGGATASPETLLLSPDFFSQGGFASFSISGLGVPSPTGDFPPAVFITPGTVISPVTQSFQLDPNGAATLAPASLPVGVRAPVSVEFNALGVFNSVSGDLIKRGDLLMGEGARIQTDPLSKVTLTGQSVAVLGSVEAPGGNIMVSSPLQGPVALFFGSPALDFVPTIDLGPQSVLSVAGTTLLTPNVFGFRTGSVLKGGNINVTGNIVAEAGSMLNVNGATDVLDLAPEYSSFVLPTLRRSFGNQALISTRVNSDAGSITMTGRNMLFMDSTLSGMAGGASAQGGSLTISSGSANHVSTPLDVNIYLTASGNAIPSSFYPAGQTAIGHVVLDSNGNPLQGPGYFPVSRLAGSGLDSVTINGNVQFSGDVNLTANRNLSLGSGGIIYADPSVASSLTLDAPYVAIGMPLQTPQVVLGEIQNPTAIITSGGTSYFVPPTTGQGALEVNAQFIDIGNLTLQKIGAARFQAGDGEIRGSGTLDVAGEIDMTAAQIYPPSATIFNIVAYDGASPGVINVSGSGIRSLPLSAGGRLNLYASEINDSGVLRAPIGTIDLGLSSQASSFDATDWLGGGTFPTTHSLTLLPGSVTSVSAIDPISGLDVVIPYGTVQNGIQWIDPGGLDITGGLVPSKVVNISSAQVSVDPGATIDVRGGGDLYAYQFVPGLGGSNDIFAGGKSFAVIPGYSGFGGDLGFSGSGLAVGDQVHLGASDGLPEGTYTLLPASYALLPGAFLVTPKTSAPAGTSQVQNDESTLVSGYRFNNLDSSALAQPLLSQFEVAPGQVFRARAEYDDFFANTWLKDAAATRNITPPRLPIDAGQLVVAASSDLNFSGSLNTQRPLGGLGSLVDLASSADILIAGPEARPDPGALVIDSSALTAMEADSLLIGGYRTLGDQGLVVTVLTPHLKVDNKGAPLTGTDIILASRSTLTLAPGADIESLGTFDTSASTLLLGDAATPGSGNGLLVRVAANTSAPVVRSGVDSSTQPLMQIGAGGVGARLVGSSVTLDSTQQTLFDPNSTLIGQNIAFNSGQISIQLDNAGTLFSDATHPLTTGLVLSKSALNGLLANAQSLSLSSYSSIDLYGDGQIGQFDSNLGQFTIQTLALHAGEIRGFNNGNGPVTVNAGDLTIDNALGATSLGTVVPVQPGSISTLNFHADTIHLGKNVLNVDQYAQLDMTAEKGILLEENGGLTTSGSATITTPIITGAVGIVAPDQTITAVGNLVLTKGASSSSLPIGGLGAILNLTGASISDATDIVLPSGQITLHATGTGGDVTLDGRLDASGTQQNFYDVAKYTDGGQISLISDNGSVITTPDAWISVAAAQGGGKGGTFSVSAPIGSFTSAGTLLGQGGSASDASGLFSLDAGSFSSLGALNAALNAGSFDQSRSFRIRTGDVLVDGAAIARNFTLSADQGTITVTGNIDASGPTGGAIALYANGGVTLDSGSILTVAGSALDDAGKGGTVDIETRGANAGQVTLLSGSTIDLSVADGAGGTLYLRAPQVSGFTDVAISPIAGSIVNPGSIVIEGYHTYSYNNASQIIDAALQSQVENDSASFASNMAAVRSRLFSTDPGGILHVRPGVEIVNSGGNLVLNSDWDLSTYRFGPGALGNGSGEPGTLTLRAAGNLVFNGALSDGFQAGGGFPLYQEALLPAGSLSWSYRLVSGADLTAADFHQGTPLLQLTPGAGSLQLGKNIANPTTSKGASGTLADVMNVNGSPAYYQVIRTGTGDIDISAARDVLLLNQFATIYTAGTQVADPTLGGTFDVPTTAKWVNNSFLKAGFENRVDGSLYPAQYTQGGGNVTIDAQNNIEHMTLDKTTGQLVLDSELQLPVNWLYRRGQIGANGTFDSGINGDKMSTTWWTSFMSFFEGVGALGGGNLTMIAGNDIANVDGLIPTNARMPKGVPNASKLVELGGGDLLVHAGHDINGGVYYVERGQGTLIAGNDVTTNARRSPELAALVSLNLATTLTPEDSLPTTLFLGKSSFDVAARGDLTIGSTANVFMLPEGISNQIWYKTYFSTYSEDAGLSLSSLTGDVTIRQSGKLPNSSVSQGLLQLYLSNVIETRLSSGSVSWLQPWLRTNDALGSSGFSTASALMAPSLEATSFLGDVNVVGNLILSPSPQGSLDLFANGAINGLNKMGLNIQNNNGVWGSSSILLSDADPSRIPSISNPLSIIGPIPTLRKIGATPGGNYDNPVDWTDFDLIFQDSGSTVMTLEEKQLLHGSIPLDPTDPNSARGPLHALDSNPDHLYTLSGDISGFTLFSGKAAEISAGQDVTDISLYLQNVRGSDVSVVSAGRDIVAYDPNSALRVQATTGANEILQGSLISQAGDIQINGPGTLEVLAGRNLDLGVGGSRSDGTGLGITSIGNARNPYLPFEGAQIIAGAGLLDFSGGVGLHSSEMDFAAFNSQYLDPATGGANAATYLPVLRDAMGLGALTDDQVWTAYQALSPEEQAQLDLQIFYLVLRDVGRNHLNPANGSSGYNDGYNAIAALFPTDKAWTGDISLTSREISTKNGGDISLLAPGGALNVGLNVPGAQASDQGILTEHGGNISIFTRDSVNVGTSRIFTLLGGNEIIWSSDGNIAAGSSSKTVQAAPPTRVLIDPQSAMVRLDLAGLATGGGIGVLESVPGVPPANVDLIAPKGAVDAGDAGVRVSGNLNIAANIILNANNIQVSGASAGVPAAAAAPQVSSVSVNVTPTTKPTSTADDAQQANKTPADIITVEVVGFGDEAPAKEDDEELLKHKKLTQADPIM